MNTRTQRNTLVAVIIASTIVLTPFLTHGQDPDELRERIQQREEQIENVEDEINKYENELQEVSQRANSLENTVEKLRTSQQKLETEIGLTEREISSKSYTIDKLQLEIQTIENNLATHRQVIADTIRQLNQADNVSLVEALLKYDTIAGFWNKLENLEQLQKQINIRIDQLNQLKAQAAQKHEAERAAKNELEGLQTELADRNQILEENKQENQELLSETKNEEATYQQILAEKRRQRQLFQQEIQNLESQLQIVIDKSKFPSKGTKALAYPLGDVSLKSCWDGGASQAHCVTQYFGNTSFSQRTNAYKGNGHNGVDFRANIGDAVFSAAPGTVQAVGNTDAISGCYSYGKWVLVKHNNGLTTLYAHLSLVKANKGDTVEQGTVIGYAGNTGYSTGPHLHFTVYASEGVRVVQYTNSINCKDAVIPIADLDAYLDPLYYL